MERHCKNNEELFASQVVYHWIQLHDLNAEQITETQTFEMKAFALSVARALDTQCSSNETQPATATEPMVQAEGTNLEGPDAEPVEIDATSVANGKAVTNETNNQKLKAHASGKLGLKIFKIAEWISSMSKRKHNRQMRRKWRTHQTLALWKCGRSLRTRS